MTGSFFAAEVNDVVGLLQIKMHANCYESEYVCSLGLRYYR